MRETAEPERLEAALTVGLHVVGKYRVHEHRHMPVNVVKHVGLGDVVHLLGRADEAGGNEAPVCQVLEEDFVGHQAGHGDDAPVGGLGEHLVEASEIRNAVGRDTKLFEPGQELRRRPPPEQRRLAREQGPPARMLGRRVSVPLLFDRMVGPCIHVRLHRCGRNGRRRV